MNYDPSCDAIDPKLSQKVWRIRSCHIPVQYCMDIEESFNVLCILVLSSDLLEKL